MKIAGICVFRNAGDLIGLVMLHHLFTLVDHVYCLDNGSSDGGFEKVEWLARRTGRISLLRDSAIREKREYLNDLARRAHRDGYDIILPFDSDELWDGTRDELHAVLSADHNVARCAVSNFIQKRSVTAPTPFSWRFATRRCVAPKPAIDGVRSGELSFMESAFPDKVVFRADAAVEIHKGQHGVDRPGRSETVCPSLTVLHLPMRARSELLKRALDYEPRRAQLRVGPNDAWQSLHWRRKVDEGQVDEEWRALSYGPEGQLDVNGRSVPTFPDRRLAAHLYRTAFSPRYGWAGLRMLKAPKEAQWTQERA